jgi:hypothetical protein
MTDDERFGALWPVEPTAPPSTAEVPTMGDLDGRTVAFLWDHLFKGPEMFDLVAASLRSEYPAISFVGHEVFGNIHATGAEEGRVLADIPDKLRQWGVDAAVLAVGA